MLEKRPRHYAFDYLQCANKKQRQAVADSVPPHLKKMVQLHIKLMNEKRKIQNG